MKKLLLGLGTLSLATLPVLVVMSCSSSKTSGKIVESVFQSWQGINIVGYTDGTATIKGFHSGFPYTNVVIEKSYFSKDTNKHYTVTNIGDYAFSKINLTLDLSQATSLERIGDYAFADSILTELDLSKNTLLTSIGNWAFQSSRSTSLDLSKNTLLTSIGNEAFQSSRLTSLDLSKNTLLTSIGNYAFASSPLTSHLILPDSVKEIGSNAFYITIDKTNLKIPAQFMTNEELRRIGITINPFSFLILKYWNI